MNTVKDMALYLFIGIGLWHIFFGEKEKKMRQQKKVTTRTDYSLFARKTVTNIFETFNTST